MIWQVSHLLVSVAHRRHDGREVRLAEDVVDVDVGALQREVEHQRRVEPGANFVNLHFGRKLFRTIFHPQILDKFSTQKQQMQIYLTILTTNRLCPHKAKEGHNYKLLT
jgi:hypothetical protein